MVSLELIQCLSIKAKAGIQSVNPGIKWEMSVARGLQFSPSWPWICRVLPQTDESTLVWAAQGTTQRAAKATC